MDRQAAQPVLPAFEANAVGERLVSQELDDEPSPFTPSATDPIGSHRPIPKPATRPSTAIIAATPAVAPPWTPSQAARGGPRRRLAMPSPLARLLAGGSTLLFPGGGGGGPSSSSSSSSPAEAELECYLIESSAYRRQRLPFGQGHLARGLARRDCADALWDNYMALDAGQKACVNRLLRRKTRTSTRTRTCVAITPFTGDDDAATTDGPAAAATAPPPKRSGFLVFLAVGHPVAPVRFRDPLGRRFEFSFELCRTWAGMEDLLLDCFPRADDEAGGGSIDARVRCGHYDLLGPDGHIVLPMVWESIVRPGWRVSMVLWPEVFARDQPQPPGPRAAAAAALAGRGHAGGVWQKALGVLRAPFERGRHQQHHPMGPTVPAPVGERREAPREILVLRQPQPSGGEARGPSTADAGRRVSLARFGSPPEPVRRHSSDMQGGPAVPGGDGAGARDARSWYAASLPRHMETPRSPGRRRSPAAWERRFASPPPGQRPSPVYSQPPPEDGSTDGGSGAGSSKASSSLRTYPSGGTGRSDDDDGDGGGGASRSSSIPDCGSDALETASLGKGIDELLGRWKSAGADRLAHETDTGSKAGGEKGREEEDAESNVQ